MIRGTPYGTRPAAIIFRNCTRNYNLNCSPTGILYRIIQGIIPGIIPCILPCILSIVLFTGLSTSSVLAAGDNYPAGARAAATGGVAITRPGFWSVWHNQAGLGFYKQLSAGVHHENRFVVPEFALSSIGFTLPTATGTFGLSWSHFGYPRYHENKFGLALGKAFHERFSAGLQIDYLNAYIDDELGSAGTVAIEAGILAEPVDKLMIGFHVYNPTASRFQKLNNERIPVIMRLGIGYHFDERLFMGVETEKDLDIQKALFRVGAEYRLIEYIYIRTGLSVQEYVQHSFGLGFNMRNIQADIAFSFQQIVGYTPYLSFLYVFR